MRRDLQTILLEDNPWLSEPGRFPACLSARLPDPCLSREVVARERGRWSDPRRAHLVIGPRQAGKSTALWTHLASQGARVLFIDCEQPLVREWCASAPLFLAEIEEIVDPSPTLFFDEVQHLAEAGLFVKGLVDRRPGSPILVTGSSSFHLGARTRESLAGRATRTRLLPFSLAEVCADVASLPPALRERTELERFSRHLVVGGYPDVWLGAEPRLLLHELVEAFVLRDASDRFRITRPDVLRLLLQLLAGQVGSLVSYAEWASVLAVSRDTVASYLAILEESHVVALLRPFVGGKRSELTSRPKAYLVDNGVRNHLVGDLRGLDVRGDRGPLLESWVFAELWKALPLGASLHYWRSTSGAEVDFVLRQGDRLLAVEVKARELRRPILPRAARSFVDAYAPEKLLLVNLALDDEASVGRTRVRWVGPTELGRQVRSFLGA